MVVAKKKPKKKPNRSQLAGRPQGHNNLKSTKAIRNNKKPSNQIPTKEERKSKRVGVTGGGIGRSSKIKRLLKRKTQYTKAGNCCRLLSNDKKYWKLYGKN